MRQNYYEINRSVNEYNEKIEKENVTYGQIQKIYSTPHLICLRARFPGLSYNLYLGRGSHYEGFWSSIDTPPPELRIKDRFLEYLRKALLSSKIRLIKIDESDRVLYIPYFKSKKVNCLSLFWKGRDLYFQNIFLDEGEKYKCLKSWVGVTQDLFSTSEMNEDEIIEFSKKNFDELGRGKFDNPRIIKKDNPGEKKEIKNYFQSDIFIKSNKEVKKRIKSLKIKLKKMEKDLERVREYKDLEKNLIEDNLDLEGASYYLILNRKIIFDNDWSSFKKKDILFKRVKKLKKGELFLMERLNSCNQEILNLENDIGCYKKSVEGKKILVPIWNNKSNKKEKLINEYESLGYEEYILDRKYRIAFGKDARGNDNLRKNFGNKEDYWFHIENYKSSHCIVKIKNISDFKSIYFEIIASLLRDKSSLNLNRIPLVFTQVKNLKGVKGKAGSVKVKKEKYRTESYNKDWKEIISNI
ncbi:NFACT RNA binding domain-containing protein [Bacteriovoracales bacterium]|nr:NFACT RNA binding domain-containing protein [Bacteriovoracales bacterium]